MHVTIQEAATRVGLTAHTLRYYEREGLMPSLKRGQHGIRVFEEGDIEWLQMIRCLRDTGMPISAVRRYVELCAEGDHTLPDRIEMLRSQKHSVEQQMAEMQGYLKRIDDKLAYYCCVLDRTSA